jgi:putative transposase
VSQYSPHTDKLFDLLRSIIKSRFAEPDLGPAEVADRVPLDHMQLIVRMASENRDWGYDRIVGALANLGYVISDQTVGNILHRHALPPAPERKRTTTWPAFVRTHLALLAWAAGGAERASFHACRARALPVGPANPAETSA